MQVPSEFELNWKFACVSDLNFNTTLVRQMASKEFRYGLPFEKENWKLTVAIICKALFNLEASIRSKGSVNANKSTETIITSDHWWDPTIIFIIQLELIWKITCLVLSILFKLIDSYYSPGLSGLFTNYFNEFVVYLNNCLNKIWVKTQIDIEIIWNYLSEVMKSLSIIILFFSLIFVEFSAIEVFFQNYYNLWLTFLN